MFLLLSNLYINFCQWIIIFQAPILLEIPMATKSTKVQFYEVQKLKASLWVFLLPIFLHRITFPIQFISWEAKFKEWSHESRKKISRKHIWFCLMASSNRLMTENQEVIFLCLLKNKISLSKLCEALARTYSKSSTTLICATLQISTLWTKLPLIIKYGALLRKSIIEVIYK